MTDRPNVTQMYKPEGEKDWIDKIPMRLKEGLIRYREEGVETGQFLRAVLENNLRYTILRADPESRACLKEILWWLGRFMPPNAWGDPFHVQEWIEDGGIKGWVDVGEGEWAESFRIKVKRELNELGRDSEV